MVRLAGSRREVRNLRDSAKTQRHFSHLRRSWPCAGGYAEKPSLVAACCAAVIIIIITSGEWPPGRSGLPAASSEAEYGQFFSKLDSQKQVQYESELIFATG